MNRILWLAVALLLAAPTFIQYEGSESKTWVCRRDGDRAGLCTFEPTVRPEFENGP